jgi:hypothetical protein
MLGFWSIWQNAGMHIVNATFRLINGVSEDEFKSVDTQFQEDFAYQQKGMLRRTTAKSDDDTWLVITFWDSVQSAEGEKNITAEGSAALTRMHECIDFDTHKLESYNTL